MMMMIMMFINNDDDDDDDELAWLGQEMQLTDWPTSRQTPFESLLRRCTHTAGQSEITL